jgi:hypothetical protein
LGNKAEKKILYFLFNLIITLKRSRISESFLNLLQIIIPSNNEISIVIGLAQFDGQTSDPASDSKFIGGYFPDL